MVFLVHGEVAEPAVLGDRKKMLEKTKIHAITGQRVRKAQPPPTPRGTSVVDGKSKNEHVASGQADDGVGDARKVSSISRIIICASPHSGSATRHMPW